MGNFYRFMIKLVKDQSGMSMILVGLSLFMIFGFASIVVDAGSLFLEKSRLQKALDAAVLAGAQRLKASESEAKNTTIEFAAKNGFHITGDNITIGSDFVRINKTVTKDLTFARILGINDADVSAVAKAQLKPFSSGEGIVPVGILKESFKMGELYTLNDPDKHSPGNFGLLAIDGNGGSVLRESIKYGTDRTQLNKKETTEPGQTWGPLKQGFRYRFDQDIGKTHCQSHETANRTCKRVVIVPIVETYEGANGRSKVPIAGFGAFWIETVEEHKVNGRFIELVTRGNSEDEAGEQSWEAFGIYVLKLVE